MKRIVITLLLLVAVLCMFVACDETVNEEPPNETESTACTSHTFGEWTQALAPTCTEKGQERRDCDHCEHFETREINATDHDYTSVVITPPTKVNDGYTTHTCSKCNDSYTDAIVPAIGSDGLAYEVNGNSKTCTIIGMGTCTDKQIAIPRTINGYQVTAIGNRAFYSCNITLIKIPATVKTIGSAAFESCTSLTSVSITNGVTSIGDFAFSCCFNLVDVSIPSSVTDIGKSSFSNCESLTGITIPDGVKTIGNSAFYSCVSLKSISIANSVTSIGTQAFRHCSSLRNIVIPDSVTSIGNYAFADCTKLTSITLSENMMTIEHNTFKNCSSLRNIKIGNNVKMIYTSAFENCKNLTTVTIPDRLIYIGQSAFSGCTSLKTVYHSNTANDWNNINIDQYNAPLTDASIYYYSETAPTTEGNYWRYVDGVPTPWA